METFIQNIEYYIIHNVITSVEKTAFEYRADITQKWINLTRYNNEQTHVVLDYISKNDTRLKQTLGSSITKKNILAQMKLINYINSITLT